MRLSALALTLALVSSPAMAENIVIGCPLVKQYSEFQVNMLLSQARSVIGENETNRIYSKYVGLKSECRANGAASRVVAVSPALRQFLAQSGVDVRSFGRLAAAN